MLALLDAAQARGIRLRFWWRDDDAVDVTAALERLLAMVAKYRAPIALAVIPRDATEALAARLGSEPLVSVLQHGWAHTLQSPQGAKKAEFGDHRPVDEMLDELGRGRERLDGLFPQGFLPILVPPWNRLSDAVADGRESVRLPGLSTFGPAPPADPRHVNTHVDIFRWKPMRQALTGDEAFALLAREIEARLAGRDEPIGILTHHLVQEAESWCVLDDILSVLKPHGDVIWPSARTLFQLP